ncbi:hypothetical protein CHL9426_08305 [Campylobacter hyointestinalis subsp. lawsonii]|nr:hypothetical protein CHL9752_07990 [Campylobacter hyointestinalis subsp. lawsonii]RAZ37623.1 hypothetical protein CHL9426_08305 [Campylobacter hyointestinalis subsp. lawsonii]
MCEVKIKKVKNLNLIRDSRIDNFRGFQRLTFGRKDRFYRSAKSKWGTPRKWGFSIWFFSTDFVRALKVGKIGVPRLRGFRWAGGV